MMSLLLSVLALILVSAFCSGSEAALYSVTELQIKNIPETPSSRAVLSIKRDMVKPTATIVVLNNIANIVGSMLVGIQAVDVFGSEYFAIFSIVLTVLVIVVAEIIPKGLGAAYALQISLAVSRPILFLVKLIPPILYVIKKITDSILPAPPSTSTSESEIKTLASIGHKEGVINDMESSIVQGAFDLDSLTAEEIMTPRVALSYVLRTETLEDLAARLPEFQHSRLVVVDVDADNPVGIVTQNDVLFADKFSQGGGYVGSICSSLLFVKEDCTCSELLTLFKSSKKHLAIVQDEYGGTSGVVTLEDVLEILVGEIVDETDTSEDLRLEAKSRF